MSNETKGVESLANANEKLMREADAALEKGDPAKMFAMFADDALIHVGGRSKISGDHKGRGALEEVFGKFMASLGENAELITHDILANDKHGVMLLSARGEHGGDRIEINNVGILNFTKGVVTEAWFFDEDPYTADKWYDAGLP